MGLNLSDQLKQKKNKKIKKSKDQQIQSKDQAIKQIGLEEKLKIDIEFYSPGMARGYQIQEPHHPNSLKKNSIKR